MNASNKPGETQTVNAAMLAIGDELLSGRTKDKNIGFVADYLTGMGIDLQEVRIVSDDKDAIAEAVNALRVKYTYLFTSGGIGPTHDDITADSVSKAFGVPCEYHPDAMALLVEHYSNTDLEFTEARKRMARTPRGASLIDNPVSKAPGFRIENVHVMAGVPKIFEAMLASVLPGLTGGAPILSQSLRVFRGEGEIAETLGDLAATFSDLSIGCYPFQKDGVFGANIVVRGTDGARIGAAMTQLAKEIDQ